MTYIHETQPFPEGDDQRAAGGRVPPVTEDDFEDVEEDEDDAESA